MATKEKTWHEAIQEVLRSKEGALHYDEILDEIQKRGLRKKFGKTPSQTVVAHLTGARKGEYVRVRRGFYALRGMELKGYSDESEDKLDGADIKQKIITSFGMYWDRKQVNWKKTLPKLLGFERRQEESIDFSGQSGVYILYDVSRPIYVGQTVRTEGLGKRLREHTTGRLKARWDRFSWFGILPVDEKGKLKVEGREDKTLPDNTLVEALEALLVEALEPSQNKKGGDNLGIEYVQAEDPSLNTEKKKRDLDEIVEKIKSQL